MLTMKMRTCSIQQLLFERARLQGEKFCLDACSTHSVKMLNRNNNFSNIYSNFVFGELFSLVQMGEKFAAVHIICEVKK